MRLVVRVKRNAIVTTWSMKKYKHKGGNSSFGIKAQGGRGSLKQLKNRSKYSPSKRAFALNAGRGQ